MRQTFYESVSEKTGKVIQSVPQIFFDDQYIGGWSELKQVCGYTFNHERLHEVTKVVTSRIISWGRGRKPLKNIT